MLLLVNNKRKDISQALFYQPTQIFTNLPSYVTWHVGAVESTSFFLEPWFFSYFTVIWFCFSKSCSYCSSTNSLFDFLGHSSSERRGLFLQSFRDLQMSFLFWRLVVIHFLPDRILFAFKTVSTNRLIADCTAYREYFTILAIPTWDFPCPCKTFLFISQYTIYIFSIFSKK